MSSSNSKERFYEEKDEDVIEVSLYQHSLSGGRKDESRNNIDTSPITYEARTTSSFSGVWTYFTSCFSCFRHSNYGALIPR